MTSLPLDDDDESPGPALSLDDEQVLAYVVKLHRDSHYAKMPAVLLQGKKIRTSELMDAEDHHFRVTNVTDFDADTQANPGPVYREITVVEVEE